ncbi:MAG: hypothetical protein AAF354_14125 [Pseudomonadota bacterium]
MPRAKPRAAGAGGLRIAGGLHITRRLTSLATSRPDLPRWLDHVLRKAVYPDPIKSQHALSEFTHDMRVPRDRHSAGGRVPLVERHARPLGLPRGKPTTPGVHGS